MTQLDSDYRPHQRPYGPDPSSTPPASSSHAAKEAAQPGDGQPGSPGRQQQDSTAPRTYTGRSTTSTGEMSSRKNIAAQAGSSRNLAPRICTDCSTASTCGTLTLTLLAEFCLSCGAEVNNTCKWTVLQRGVVETSMQCSCTSCALPPAAMCTLNRAQLCSAAWAVLFLTPGVHSAGLGLQGARNTFVQGAWQLATTPFRVLGYARDTAGNVAQGAIDYTLLKANSYATVRLSLPAHMVQYLFSSLTVAVTSHCAAGVERNQLRR